MLKCENFWKCTPEMYPWVPCFQISKCATVSQDAVYYLVAVRDHEVCSSECSSDGCWGPADNQCLSCANFTLNGERCVSSCNSLPDIYQSGSRTCSHCNPECDGCTNAVCTIHYYHLRKEVVLWSVMFVDLHSALLGDPYCHSLTLVCVCVCLSVCLWKQKNWPLLLSLDRIGRFFLAFLGGDDRTLACVHKTLELDLWFNPPPPIP